MDACRRMGIIRRADTFVLLVDGAKLADPGSRQRAKNDPVTLLRNCLDAGMLNSDAAVDVLVTKWDLVEKSTAKKEVEEFAGHVEQSILRLFSDRVKRIRVARVAAHPFDSALPFGFGLPELCKAWVEHSAASGPMGESQQPDELGLSEFDRYLSRRLPPAGEAGA